MSTKNKEIGINEAYVPFFQSEHRFAVLYGGGGCFSHDTLVQTESGHKRISDISIGDKVLSFNEQTLRMEYKPVDDIFIYATEFIDDSVIQITLNNGKKIKCTSGHKFYVNGHWVMARNLAGGNLETRCGSKENVLHIKPRAAYDDKPQGEQEVGDYAPSIGRWIPKDNDNKGYGRVYDNTDTQARCVSFCAEPGKPTGSQSQEWDKDGQPYGKLGVGDTQAECSTLIRHGITVEQGWESPTKQIDGKGCCGDSCDKGHEGYSCETKDCGEVRGFVCNDKRYYSQAEQGLAARQINPSEISRVDVIHCNFVYDLNVRDNHNYCVTDENIIVHNSGKSVAAAQKWVSRIMNEKTRHRFLFIRKYRTSVENSVFELTKQVISDWGLMQYVKINRTNLGISFRNGSSIITAGLDDPEKIKSIAGITGIWIEEATELEEGDFDQINLRLRGRTPSYKQIVLTFNPVSELHWLKRKFFDEVSPKVFTLHTNYKHNQFLDEDYIHELEQRYEFDENMKRIYVDGKWGKLTTGSLFYSKFKHDKHVSDVDYIKGIPLHVSFDFNVNPYMPMAVYQVYSEEIDGKTTYIVNQIDEIIGKNPDNTTEALCGIFKDRWGDVIREKVYIYGDASGKVHSPYTRMNHYDVIQRELRGIDTKLRILPKNPSIEKRRLFMNKVLAGGYPIKININPRCKYSINDFEDIIEAQNKDGNTKKHVRMRKDKVTGVSYEENGHFSDIWDYFICGCFESYFLDFEL